MIGAFQYLNSVHLANTQAMLVQELLKNPNCRLEELLDEDGVVQEFKEAKPGVMGFFDNAKLDRLLEFVLLDAEAPDDRKSSFKFPSVAAELLSAPVAKVLDYFLQRRDERLVSFDQLLSPVYDAAAGQRRVEQNLTRLGYVQKIVMTLFGARPLVFMPYLLGDKELLAGIIANCHSKSMHGLLLLLLLGQNALQLSPPADSQVAKELETLRVTTLGARQELLTTLLTVCLEAEEAHDAHINVCGLLTTLFPRDFPDKPAFLQLFATRFLGLFAADLTRNFPDAHNRAYSVLFAFVEAACKEGEGQASHLPDDAAAELIAGMMALVSAASSAPRARQSATEHPVQTSSYGKELQKSNSKLIRLIDVLRLLVHARLEAQGFEPALQSRDFATGLVRLMAHYPQNNILHNQILKFWLMLVGCCRPAVFAFFFADCEDFRQLLLDTARNAADNFSHSKNPARNGFLGHLKTLFDSIVDSPLAKEAQKLPHFALFEEKFFAVEKVVETYCLGDVDVGQVDVEAETTFAFTVEDFQRKYAAFLGVEEEPTADSEAETPEAEEPAGEPREIQRINSHEMDEDARNLELMTVEEETAFFDSNYWRPIIDYDIEKLSLEMGFNAL